METGLVVKSLDFNGIDDCYMIGKVVSVGKMDNTFRAKFIKRVWQGKEDRKFKCDYFTVPMQGQHMFDTENRPRVIVLG